MIPYTIPEKITQVTFESTDYIIPAGKRYLDQLVKLLDKQKYKKEVGDFTRLHSTYYVFKLEL